MKKCVCAAHTLKLWAKCNGTNRDETKIVVYLKWKSLWIRDIRFEKGWTEQHRPRGDQTT